MLSRLTVVCGVTLCNYLVPASGFAQDYPTATLENALRASVNVYVRQEYNRNFVLVAQDLPVGQFSDPIQFRSNDRFQIKVRFGNGTVEDFGLQYLKSRAIKNPGLIIELGTVSKEQVYTVMVPETRTKIVQVWDQRRKKWVTREVNETVNVPQQRSRTVIKNVVEFKDWQGNQIQ